MNNKKKVRFSKKNKIIEYYENSKEKKYKKKTHSPKIYDFNISRILYSKLPSEKDYINQRILNKKYKSLKFIEDCYYKYQMIYNVIEISDNIKVYYKFYLEKDKEYIKIKIVLEQIGSNNYVKEEKIYVGKNFFDYFNCFIQQKNKIKYYKTEYKAKIKIIKIIRKKLKNLKIN